MREYEDPVARFGNRADLDQEEIDKLRQEILNLKGRLDDLERKNRILKQQNYDLTIRYSRNPANRKLPMPIAFENQPQDSQAKNFTDNISLSLNSTRPINESINLSANDKKPTTEENDLKNEKSNLSEDASPPQTSQNEKEIQSKIQNPNFEKSSSPTSYSGSTTNKISLDSSKNSAAKNIDPNISSIKRTDSNRSNPENPENPENYDQKSEKSTSNNNINSFSRSNSILEHRINPESNRKRNKAQNFIVEGELIGHKGAVYSLEYSNHKEWIASGSFDQTVRIWDTMECKQVSVLEGHKMSVSSISWSDAESSPKLASGGFDGKIIEWDLASMQCANIKKKQGLIQSLIYNKQNSNLVYSSGSNGLICVDDMRSSSTAGVLGNSFSPVSTIAQLNENEILSSNLNGFVHLWDKRYPCPESSDQFSQKSNGIERVLLKLDHAISNICLTFHERTGVAFLAVNSYDDTLRIYDRINNTIDSSNDSSSFSDFQPDFSSNSFSASASLPHTYSNANFDFNPRLIKEIRDIKSCNWPIRSAFFSETATKALLGRNSIISKSTNGYDGSSRSTIQDDILGSGLMIATGSANPYGFVHWVSFNDSIDSTVKPSNSSSNQNSNSLSYNTNNHANNINGNSNGESERRFSTLSEGTESKSEISQQNQDQDQEIDSSEHRNMYRSMPKSDNNSNSGDGGKNFTSSINLNSTNSGSISNSGLLAKIPKPKKSYSKSNDIDNMVWPQKLTGHSDMVYTVATHNWKLQMCTASADSTILLWKPSHYFGNLISNYDILNLPSNG
ncbi:WD repeat-containing protein 5 [Smittium culicis]|uniref:WD repeat-containing protein 5 n=1 Tax=Smittium culicis TaxID=133412 RepID=A0A1R1Y9S4_9FUNG|nr:WD repeat-containing protein 5 [Smittium culicis]